MNRPQTGLGHIQSCGLATPAVFPQPIPTQVEIGNHLDLTDRSVREILPKSVIFPENPRQNDRKIRAFQEPMFHRPFWFWIFRVGGSITGSRIFPPSGLPISGISGKQQQAVEAKSRPN
uniref:Uncharacterized protein n=1 Tax=Candidatus Kentrum sp. TC TaxID=2126339 RepID=A0A450ZD43_9GAMM|nr:MAG: hypothetical protein BECKTC1821D_GA0114238_11379 [Candidatus Kentron sp. TC]